MIHESGIFTYVKKEGEIKIYVNEKEVTNVNVFIANLLNDIEYYKEEINRLERELMFNRLKRH